MKLYVLKWNAETQQQLMAAQKNAVAEMQYIPITITD